MPRESETDIFLQCLRDLGLLSSFQYAIYSFTLGLQVFFSTYHGAERGRQNSKRRQGTQSNLLKVPRLDLMELLIIH